MTAPVARDHPALIAQAAATLRAMCPDRRHLTLATGEALNERSLGYDWPAYEERRRRLVDACEIVRLLWDGGFHDYDGHHWDLDTAQLYTLPDERPPLYVAANGPNTAEVAGRYADGFLTLVDIGSYEADLEPAIRRGATADGRDPADIERIKQASVAYAETEAAAVDAIEFWSGTLAVDLKEDVADPREIETRAADLSREEWRDWGLVTTDAEDVRALLERHAAAGFDGVELLVSAPGPEGFVGVLDESVLPDLSTADAD